MSSDTSYKGTYTISIQLPIDRENDSEAELIRQFVTQLRESTSDFHKKSAEKNAAKFTATPTVAVKWAYDSDAVDANPEKAASPAGHTSPAFTPRRVVVPGTHSPLCVRAALLLMLFLL
jgi:hypothetical protein